MRDSSRVRGWLVLCATTNRDSAQHSKSVRSFRRARSTSLASNSITKVSFPSLCWKVCSHFFNNIRWVTCLHPVCCDAAGLDLPPQWAVIQGSVPLLAVILIIGKVHTERGIVSPTGLDKLRLFLGLLMEAPKEVEI